NYALSGVKITVDNLIESKYKYLK
ncbi:MAG: hypothetical protein UV94_C0041G0001, partial [Parcubacteria group bacterium GW2011_GWC1_43_30]